MIEKTKYIFHLNFYKLLQPANKNMFNSNTYYIISYNILNFKDGVVIIVVIKVLLLLNL